MAARFRWGEAGLSFTGAAGIGEVEDYLFSLNAILGDYNHNGTVDAADYVLWRKTAGQAASPAFSGADGSGNSVVDSADYGVWRANFGAPAPAAILVETAAETASSSNL